MSSIWSNILLKYASGDYYLGCGIMTIETEYKCPIVPYFDLKSTSMCDDQDKLYLNGCMENLQTGVFRYAGRKLTLLYIPTFGLDTYDINDSGYESDTDVNMFNSMSYDEFMGALSDG